MMTMDKLEFEYKGEKYYIKKPSQKEINEAELVYKVKYSEALRNGAVTGPEARKIMSSRDIWSADDDTQLRKLFLDLADKSRELEKTDSLNKGSALIYEMEKIRMDIMTLNMRRNSILDNTAESYADEHRLQYYVLACAHKATGEKLYDSMDHYLAYANDEIAKIAITKTIHLIANEGKDFRSDWPETIWRQKKGLVDKDLNPVPEKIKEVLDEMTSNEIKKEPKKSKKVKA